MQCNFRVERVAAPFACWAFFPSCRQNRHKSPPFRAISRSAWPVAGQILALRRFCQRSAFPMRCFWQARLSRIIPAFLCRAGWQQMIQTDDTDRSYRQIIQATLCLPRTPDDQAPGTCDRGLCCFRHARGASFCLVALLPVVLAQGSRVSLCWREWGLCPWFGPRMGIILARCADNSPFSGGAGDAGRDRQG